LICADPEPSIVRSKSDCNCCIILKIHCTYYTS
jgi:hypothetical protein